MRYSLAAIALAGVASALPRNVLVLRSTSSNGSGGRDFSGGRGNGPSEDWQKQLVDAHNAVRSECGQSPIVWNDELANQAAGYTAQCNYGHSGMDGVGENIAEGSGSAGSADGLCKLWSDEKNGGSDTGHYTQMVWKDTTDLGCGYQSCGGMQFLVCQYWPAGNVIGEEGGQVCAAGAPAGGAPSPQSGSPSGAKSTGQSPSGGFPSGGSSPKPSTGYPSGGQAPSHGSRPRPQREHCGAGQHWDHSKNCCVDDDRADSVRVRPRPYGDSHQADSKPVRKQCGPGEYWNAAGGCCDKIDDNNADSQHRPRPRPVPVPYGDNDADSQNRRRPHNNTPYGDNDADSQRRPRPSYNDNDSDSVFKRPSYDNSDNDSSSRRRPSPSYDNSDSGSRPSRGGKPDEDCEESKKKL